MYYISRGDIMAINGQIRSLKVVMKLNNGTTATGGIKTVSVSLGGGQEIDATAYAANLTESRQKAYSLASTIVPAFTKSLTELQEDVSYKLTNE